jgi:hypothetical protein
MTRRLMLIPVVLALGVPAEALGAGALVDKVSVPPTPNAQIGKPGNAALTAGVEYTVRTSGTITARTEAGRSTVLDAYYCFEGCGAAPTTSNGLAVSPTAEPGTATPAFSTTRPAYRPDHVYESSFQVRQTAIPYWWGYPFSFGSRGETYSGAIEVEVYGPVCATPDAKLKAIAGEPDGVSVRYADGPWTTATAGMTLCAGHELATTPDDTATIEFADGSTTELRPASVVKITSYLRTSGLVKTELLLRVGEVASEVKKTAIWKSDFSIRSPTATASVRGTVFSMLYDAGSNTSVVSVTEGSVAVDAVASKDVVLGPGQEVEVGARRTSGVAKVGRAGTPRGGLSRGKARAAVLAVIAGAGACKVVVARLGLKTIKKGWRVTATLTGGRSGAAVWAVVGKRVTASNALAKQVAGRCA